MLISPSNFLVGRLNEKVKSAIDVISTLTVKTICYKRFLAKLDMLIITCYLVSHINTSKTFILIVVSAIYSISLLIKSEQH